MTLLLLACTDTIDAEPHFDEPDSAGSYAAVTRELDGTWQVWYPSEQGEGVENAEYDDMLRGEAWSQGTPACDQVRPVVVFSHGHRGIRWQSVYLTERLAAHGYVVIAPDHLDNTFMDGEGGATPEIAARRPGEVRASFDRLLDYDTVADCVDPEAGYAVVGHSFGAFTALAVAGAGIDLEGLTQHCLEDPGDLICGAEELLAEAEPIHDEWVWATMPITPGGAKAFGDRAADLQVPILIIGGEADTTTPVDEEAIPIFEALTAETRHLALIEGAGHFTFTDICALPGEWNGCGPDYIDQAVAQDLSNTLMLALLGQARGFDTAAWLPPDSAVLDFQ